MNRALTYVGSFVGLFIAGCIGVQFLIVPLSIIGGYIGYAISKEMDEEEARRKKLEEELANRRWEEERKRRQIETQINKARDLAKKYPEATKKYFKQHWGITKLIITDSDISSDRATVLLSHEYTYERDEQELNAAFRAKLEAEKEARRKKEETERLEKLRRQQEETRRQQEEAKRKEALLKAEISSLPSCVSSWNTPSNSSIKHKYFVDYYPYERYKDSATYSMKQDWKLVWCFKNDDRISVSEHKQALDQVISMTEAALRSSFGNKTRHLTLVCLTASTREANKRRFEAFSSCVCSDLGMKNGYDHIRIIADAVPKHLGGDGKCQKNYDEYFFNGSQVILFDDVRTSGRGLEREKQRLEAMGAKVIGAITIAQTQW